MHPYPHTYIASATAQNVGFITVNSPQSPSLETAAPPEFDGPGGVWSPESLLCASVADCFILTFRAVARAARFTWLQLECRTEGVLERAEHGCLISNSLRGSRTLEAQVVTAEG